MSSFEGLWTGTRFDASMLRDAKVLAIAGVGDPVSFGGQLLDYGARVSLRAPGDHHAYTDADAKRFARWGRDVDFVIMTAKDAVKLRSRWPLDEREPLVAGLTVHWEAGYENLEQTLAGLWNGGGESRGN